MAKKKVRLIDEDRISILPDELIHKIYSFLDIKEAVQASVLSKRWKLIWTTLPFIAFGRYADYPHPACFSSDNPSKYAMFIRHVLCNRNHQSSVSELKLYVPDKLTVQQSVSRKKFRGCVIETFIQYAIEHNVECLDTGFDNFPYKWYKLYPFRSNSLKKLTLRIPFEICPLESDCWDLPALTTLHLKGCWDVNPKFPELLTSLPALRTLLLDSWDLSETSFSLANLTTLHMVSCRFTQMVWDLPALLNLHLDIRDLPKNMCDMLSTLASLETLTLNLSNSYREEDLFISCPQLLNLNIRTNYHARLGNIVVSSAQLCNFSAFGIFLITFKVAELENVDIKLKGWRCENLKIYHERFPYMLSGLGIANNISFDLESIKALAKKSDFLASCSSPFYNLKCVKLPKEYIESSIPSALRNYLLSGSRGATIVTSLPRKNMIPQTRAVSPAAENVVVLEPLAPPTKELGDGQYINKAESVDTLDMGVQEQNVMENSLVDPSRARQTNPPVVGKNRILQTLAVSVVAENVVPLEPLASPTKELGNYQYINEAASVDTLDMGVQEQNVMENSLVNPNGARQTNPPVVGVNNNRVCSSEGNRDIGLWQGHEVNSEFVCLLDHIMHKYPETFEHFTTKNEKLCTMNLNMLGTSVNDFTKISLIEVDSEMIVEYRDAFAYLQNRGFNVSWLVNRLNYIEHLRFSKPLNSRASCH